MGALWLGVGFCGCCGLCDTYFGFGCISGEVVFLLVVIGDVDGCFSFVVLIGVCVDASVWLCLGVRFVGAVGLDFLV